NRLRRHVGRGFAPATFPQPGLGSDAARALVVRSDGAGPDLADPARDHCRAAPARQSGERGRVRAAPNAVFNQTDPRAVSPGLMLRSENATMDHIRKALDLAAARREPIRFSWVREVNIEGTADLLFAYYQGIVGAPQPPGSLGAAFFIPTLIVPPLLATHALIFWQLLRGPASQRMAP